MLYIDDDVTANMDDIETISVTADIFSYEPTKEEKIKMRKEVMSPSAWLTLLCKDWVADNEMIAAATDEKLAAYKPYSKGLLSSPLLCRLSIPSVRRDIGDDGSMSLKKLDFWEILGITDSFDRCYIVAQIERFCFLYSIQGNSCDDYLAIFGADLSDPSSATLVASTDDNLVPVTYVDQHVVSTAATAAAAVVAVNNASKASMRKTRKITVFGTHMPLESELSTNEEGLEIGKAQYQMDEERPEQENFTKEARTIKKSTNKATQRDTQRALKKACREERKKYLEEIRQRREMLAQQQKEAAMKRAAELVASNRVPIEITRGATAAKVAPMIPAQCTCPEEESDPLERKTRSPIVISTAGDLHQIVTMANNLYTKYMAIAKEHNQKVHWVTVSKELGIHVKVREKYNRMYLRAKRKGFDFVKNAHYKIKDHPEIFFDPSRVPYQHHVPNNDNTLEERVAVTVATVTVDATIPAPANTFEQVPPDIE